MSKEEGKLELVRLAMALATARASVGIQMQPREIVQYVEYLEAYILGAQGLGWELPSGERAPSAQPTGSH